MKKTVCVVLSLLLVLLCGCGGSGKTAPNRPEVTSEERQFAAPADGDLIAIFTTNDKTIFELFVFTVTNDRISLAFILDGYCNTTVLFMVGRQHIVTLHTMSCFAIKTPHQAIH